MSHLFYILAAAALALLAPAQTMATSTRLFVILGAIGLWRYGWLLLTLARAVIYATIVYPRMKRAAQSFAAANGTNPHAYFLITSYRISETVSRRVYKELFAAAQCSGGGATVVASLVDESDERLVRDIHRSMGERGSPVRLEILRIAGTGKRDALACGLEAIAKMKPKPDDIVALVDGDSCVPHDIVKTAAPFLAFDPRVGALTTDEICVVDGSQLFQDWFELRFAQRQMMMCSMGLSRRVLTLTGRMSLFVARIAIDPDFIRHVRDDSIQHWRLGEVKFLTGDDKSTWFWLLRHGYQMLYLPDVRAVSLESQPSPSFIGSARSLMMRWYGNTLRNNGRSLRLGPRRIGLFTWWSILDQRLSMWTTLFGPIGAIMGALFVDPFILPLYVAWVMMTRYAACAVLTLFRGPIKVSYPMLLYFSQVYGAVLKTQVFFRPDRQKWTRQNTVLAMRSGGRASTQALSTIYMQALAWGSLVTLVALLMDQFQAGGH